MGADADQIRAGRQEQPLDRPDQPPIVHGRLLQQRIVQPYLHGSFHPLRRRDINEFSVGMTDGRYLHWWQAFGRGQVFCAWIGQQET